MANELVPMQEVMELGNVLARSGYFTDSRDAAQAVVKVLAGRELGFGPIASMTGVYIVKGKVALSANLMAAAIKRSGRYNYRVLELTDKACRIEFYENGQAIGTSEFTMENAAKAGLASETNWGKYPRNMLFARALSNGAKWYCPDLSGGPLYTPDELGAVIDGDTGEVIEATATVVEHQSQGTNGNSDNPAGPTSTAHSGLPFRPTVQAAVGWAIKEAPDVWPVDKNGLVVERAVENSFRKLIADGLAGDALMHAWMDKVHQKQADYDAAHESGDLLGAGLAGTVEQ